MPWITISAIDPETECVMVSTRATLRRRRDLPRFFAVAQTLWTHLQTADGLIGYELHASLASATLSTVSAWRDQDTMLTFTHGPAHQRVIEQARHLVTASRVRSWVTTGQQLQEHKQAALSRIETELTHDA